MSSDSLIDERVIEDLLTRDAPWHGSHGADGASLGMGLLRYPLILVDGNVAESGVGGQPKVREHLGRSRRSFEADATGTQVGDSLIDNRLARGGRRVTRS